MNKVILMGRLTKDPEVRYSQKGNDPMAVAKYTLAVDRRFSRGGNGSDQQTADFIRCTAFGKAGEFAEKYFHKGTKIAVTGRIQTGQYQDKDGKTVYTTDVIVEDQEFAESKASADRYQAGGQGSSFIDSQAASYSAPAPAPIPEQAAPAPVTGTGDDGFINIPEGIDQELPFN